MGEIDVGDELFGRDGRVCRVTFKTPVMYDHKCYEITFSDGQKITADAEHRWYVESSRKGKPAGNHVLTTEEIAKTYKDGNRNRYAIPVAGALQLEAKKLPVDPYVLGVRLGDGNSCAALGVMKSKHIPMAYLRASEHQRMELLRGLMDTAGYIGKKDSVEFCTSQDRLKDDFMELCWSLGFKPVCRRFSSANAWRITFTAYKENPVFKLKRKAERLRSMDGARVSETMRRRIVNVKEVGSVPVRCIQVDSDDHLFLAGLFMVPTHNTESGNNWIGYIVDHAPGPTMLVQPTVDIAKRLSKQRLAPLIQETPRLREKIKDSRSRDSGNTVLMKEFPGGVMIITGANSAAGLRSMPARYLFLDEIDAYPEDVDGEGEPCELAIARTRTFARRKIYKSSTPTFAGSSRIEASFEDSDKRRYYVPCPHCNEKQTLVWKNVVYRPEHEPTEAVYVCEHCGCEIEEHHKTWMLECGEWIAERPGHRGGKVAGFHLNSLYSPVGWFSWLDAARMWVKATRSKNQDLLRVFVNTVLAETWKEKGEVPDWKRLFDRREIYEINSVPTPLALFLTAAVDVQKDRLEVEVKAWGRGKKSWSIDHRIFLGSYTDKSPSGPWQKVDDMLNESWRHPSGHLMQIAVMVVDASAYTMEVRDWCRKYPMTRVMAVKGSSTMQTLISKPRPVDVSLNGQVIKNGLHEWTIGVSKGKEEIYGWLMLDKPVEGDWSDYPDGYMFIPEYPDEYFKQLTAEQIVVKVVKGYRRYEWEAIRDRNEVLDLAVYNRVAATAFGIDRFNDDDWETLENSFRTVYHRQEETAPARRRDDFWR